MYILLILGSIAAYVVAWEYPLLTNHLMHELGLK